MELLGLIVEHQSTQCSDRETVWIRYRDALDQGHTAIPDGKGVFHRSNRFEGAPAASIDVSVDSARRIFVVIPSNIPGNFGNCSISSVSSSAGNVYGVTSTVCPESYSFGCCSRVLRGKNELKEATIPALMWQIDIEINLGAIEVAVYSAMLDRGRFVGLAGVYGVFVDGINAFRGDLPWAIGTKRLTVRAIGVRAGQSACEGNDQESDMAQRPVLMLARLILSA